MLQHDISFSLGTNEPEGAACDALRRSIGRSDIDDTTLRDAVRDVIESSPRLCALGDMEVLVERIVAGVVEEDIRLAVMSALCLPAPVAPLAMPTQVLERARTPFFARLFGRVRTPQG
ncbi:hypothetical protein C8N35_102155 [Breoghania corrubedonensis]|uniref:Uncharacterized protein n=1 Tax=Breoghania corrubedonensis TaxID=665038 RepID=A0A2T5VCI6_9HYPH|nr:hypothetical protein [Breoghania corrubedonensis]PTW61445.1 hypothetical protein C8N35_102155 [Breoghania corrubedonensis]